MGDRIDLLPAELPDPDGPAVSAVRERAGQVIRPAGALARLDEVAAWLAGWQRTSRPAVRRPAAIVFVADHGVAAEGVSAYPTEVTKAMLGALEEGSATAAVMARCVGAELRVVDVGVGRPTGDLIREPALSLERFRGCVDAGRRAVAELESDLLVLGEMGIGNTTAATAVCAKLFGGPVEWWTGRGTGIDDVGYARKLAAVDAARCRLVGVSDPIEILRQVGGGELVAIAAAVVEARVRSIPVVLDGYVVAAAVAPLEIARPGALDHCIAGHRSSEPGHRRVLERVRKTPLLDLGLGLGEASGALAAVPLIGLAAACVTEVATFDEQGIPR